MTKDELIKFIIEEYKKELDTLGEIELEVYKCSECGEYFFSDDLEYGQASYEEPYYDYSAYDCGYRTRDVYYETHLCPECRADIEDCKTTIYIIKNEEGNYEEG